MIHVERDGAIATITLSRPQTRNALPIADWHALAEAAREIAASDARCVLLQS
ncbi:MAG: enoyl-CoA hydratase, partial [Sphingomonadales bacterium]